MALIFLAQIVLARLLDIEEYGVYTYVLSYLGVLTLVGRFGVDSTFVRFIPEYLEKKAWGSCHGLLSRGFTGALLASAGIAIGLALVVFARQGSLSPPLALCFMLSAFVLPLAVLLKLVLSALYALRHPIMSIVAESILQPSILIAAAAAIYLTGIVSATAYAIFAATLLTVSVTLLFAGNVLFRHAIPLPVLQAVPVFRSRLWAGVSAPLFIISSMYVVMNYSDIIMLGLLTGTAETGIYTAAARVAGLVAVPLGLFNTMMSSYVSAYYFTGQLERLQELLTRSVGYAGVISGVVFGILFLFRDFALGLFGPEFRQGAAAMTILMSAQLFSVLCGSVGFILSSTGHQKPTAYILVGGALLNLALNYLLIPQMGLSGAAVATGVSIIFWNVALLAMVRSRTGLRPTFLPFLHRPAGHTH